MAPRSPARLPPVPVARPRGRAPVPPSVERLPPLGPAPVTPTGQWAVRRLLAGLPAPALPPPAPGPTSDANEEAAARSAASLDLEPQAAGGGPAPLSQTPPGGAPLDPDARATLEALLRADFSTVRVHTGHLAALAARAARARAFTVGDHLVFGPGQYAPQTDAGRRLLAHELTHVLQQRSGQAPRGQPQRMIDNYRDEEFRRIEREAAERRRKAHEAWVRSHQERSGVEIGAQATSVSEERSRTEQALIMQRMSMLEALSTGQELLQKALAAVGVDLPSALPPNLQARWGAARQMQEAIDLSLTVYDVPFELQEEARGVFEGYYLSLGEFARFVEDAQQRREAKEEADYQRKLEQWRSQRELRIGGSLLLYAVGGTSVTTTVLLFAMPPVRGYRAPKPFSPQIPPVIEKVRAASDFMQWREVVSDFKGSTRAMDDLLLYLLPSSSDLHQNFTYLRDLDARLERLEREQPLAVRIPAVFYPKDDMIQVPGEGGATVSMAKGIPWQFYLYHTGVREAHGVAQPGEWVLLDITSPRQEKSNKEDSSGIEAIHFQQNRASFNPPRELFEALNHKLRFPKGHLYWQVPGKAIDDIETTASNTFWDWLGYIGMALAAIALIAGIIVTGGLAAPAAAPALGAIAVAAGIGAAGFSIASTVGNLHEKSKHGMLTEQDIDRAVLSIAIDLIGAFSLGLGRLVAGAAQAGQAAARGQQLVNMGSRLAAFSGRYWFMVRGAARVTAGLAVAGDVTQIMTATADFVTAYRAIQNHPGLTDEQRERALKQLVATSLLSGGLLALSLKGNFHDAAGLSNIRPGADLHLAGVDERGVATLASTEPPPAIAAGAPGAPGAPDLPTARPTPGAGVDAPPTPRTGDAPAPGTVHTIIDQPALATVATGTAPGWSRPRLQAPPPRTLDVDASLPEGKVEVRIHRDKETDLVIDITIHQGPNARPRDVEIHQQIAEAIRTYGGFLGRIRQAFDRLLRIFGADPPPLHLQMELRKLHLTISDRIDQLARPNLSRRERARLLSQIEFYNDHVKRVENAIADPNLRSMFPVDVVGLPTPRPAKPNVIVPPNHHIRWDPHANRWQVQINQGKSGARFRVEYDDAGKATGRVTNQRDLEQRIVGLDLSDPATRKLLVEMDYRIDSNDVIYRPRGHDAPGQPTRLPLTTDANGRIEIAATESVGEVQIRIRSGLDATQTATLTATEGALGPNERVWLVEGLHDTGATWSQVLSAPKQAQLTAVLTAEGLAAPEINRLITNLTSQTGTIKVVLGTPSVRAGADYTKLFTQTHGAPQYKDVHHGHPLYLGGGHSPVLLFDLPDGPHKALHKFFNDLTLPNGVRLEPNTIQASVAGVARPGIAVIDKKTGAIRFVPL